MSGQESSPPLPELETWQKELHAEIPRDDGVTSAPKYDFRATPRVAKQQPQVTWIDQDDSGNYDPDSDKLPVKRRRDPMGRSENVAPKTPNTRTWPSKRSNGFSGVILLKFASEYGKAFLKYIKALDSGMQTTPDSDNGNLNLQQPAVLTRDLINPRPQKSTTYELRKRSENAGDYDICLPEDQKLRIWGSTNLADITPRHPGARGCKVCFKHDNYCPLLDDSKYPCQPCRVYGNDCELIIEPEKKDACQPCYRREIGCSYKDNGSDHTQPCTQCSAKELKCFAGPAARTGLIWDRDPSDGDPTWTRRCTICNACKCSLRKKGSGLCAHCRDNDDPCIFEPLESSPSAHKEAKEAKEAAINTFDDDPDRLEILENEWPSRQIKTGLAHPITFNYQTFDNDNNTNNRPTVCNWCSDVLYGLLGLGDLVVEVADMPDHSGYLELGNGHTAAGHLPSRMCQFCTLDRLSIVACSKDNTHDLQYIESIDLENFDYDSVIQYLTPGMASSAPFPWCSVCPAPAFFKCVAEPEISKERLEMGDQFEVYRAGKQGCGLQLCESCAVTLVGEHVGSLEGLIDQLRMEKDVCDDGDGDFKLRADAEFLHPDGELMRRIDSGGLFLH